MSQISGQIEWQIGGRKHIKLVREQVVLKGCKNVCGYGTEGDHRADTGAELRTMCLNDPWVSAPSGVLGPAPKRR